MKKQKTKVYQVVINSLPQEGDFNNYEVVFIEGKKIQKKYHEKIHYKVEEIQGDLFFYRLIKTALRLAE